MKKRKVYVGQRLRVCEVAPFIVYQTDALLPACESTSNLTVFKRNLGGVNGGKIFSAKN